MTLYMLLAVAWEYIEVLLCIFTLRYTLYFYSTTFNRRMLYFLLHHIYFTYLVISYSADLGDTKFKSTLIIIYYYKLS